MNAPTGDVPNSEDPTVPTGNSTPIDPTGPSTRTVLRPSILQDVAAAPPSLPSTPRSKGRPSRSVLRERSANNCSPITDYLSPKREKRKAQDSDSVDLEANPTPKKVAMSLGSTQSNESMEVEVSLSTLLVKLNSMSKTNDENFQLLNKQITESNSATNARIDKLIEANNSEMSLVRDRLDHVEERLSRTELPNVSEKIARLDYLISRHEKDLNKLDIVIKGLALTNPNNLVGDVEDFLAKYFELKDVVSTAKPMGKSKLICASLINLETKTCILKSKKDKLKDTNIYIELPLTSQERDSRKKLFDLAQTERDRGKTVKIFPWGLIVDGKKFRLDHRTDSLVELSTRPGRQKNES